MTITKPENINIDFSICHNCKVKKPVELMIKCKNKDSIRPYQTYFVYNLDLIRSKLLISHFI